MKLKFVAALLAGSAMCLSTSAFAQELAVQAAPESAEPDPSDATADATIANANAVDDAQAKIELLQAQVEALQASIEQIKTSMVKTTPTWKGGPQFDDKEAGFSFKPKGLLQYDAGYVGFPGDERRGTVGGVNFGNLGWNSRPRRLTIGADGSLPGGFRYSVEFNLAQATVDYEDVLIAYDFKNSPLTAQVGYFYPFSSLETMTSSKYTSFMERAGFTDAFTHNRRIGAALTATDKKMDSWTFQAGIFNEPIDNPATFQRTGWDAAVRAVYSPTLGNVRLHLGANLEYRQNRREAQSANYQARPMTQITDQRFISTGAISAKGDTVAGIEVAAIMKSFHFAAEAQKLWTHGTYTPAEQSAILADLTTNTTPNGTPYNGNPSFWGGYVEAGFFLTGETRNYKGGSFQRVKVLHPFNDGGWGAFQINGRVDYLNLTDRVDGSSPSLGAPFYVNGGKQIAYQVSGIWNPTDYLRFMAQYSHIDVTGGPRNALGEDLTEPVNKRKFNSDVLTMRAQVDF